jgi:hypothetical protein
MKITLVTNHDDWEGIYIDGKLYTEGHRVGLEDLAEALKLDFEKITADCKWLLNSCGLPADLEDVVEEI